MIVRDPQLDDQVAGVHALASELEQHGFGGQLLAAAFKFARRRRHPVYWIYGFKTGTWWPFVPTGEKQERDNAQELELKAKLEKELPVEPDLSKWLAPVRRPDLTGELHTERLILRQWRDSDREPFAELNADAETMRYFPATLTREESDAFVDRIDCAPRRGRLGPLGGARSSVARRSSASSACSVPRFAPELVEVGWRLHRDHWGNGYATEAARESLRFGFEELGLEEIVSFTTVANTPSRKVMERIGMTHDPSRDFDHPNLPDWPQKRHVFYAITRP